MLFVPQDAGVAYCEKKKHFIIGVIYYYKKKNTKKDGLGILSL